MSEIREDEWLLELEKLSRKNDAGQSVEDLSRAIGRSVNYVRKLLRRAMELGMVTVGTRTGMRIDGKTVPVPVYLIRSTKPSPRAGSTTPISVVSRRAKR